MKTIESEATVEEMFSGEEDNVKEQISMLAEHIAIEMNAVEQLSEEHAKRNEKLEQAKTKLYEILKEAGMDSCKLESGLKPKTKVNRKFFKAEGVDDSKLHDWLKENDLGDIIIPYVHFGTLQSTLKAHEDLGNQLPDTMFNVSLQPTIIMYGKTNFLEERKNK